MLFIYCTWSVQFIISDARTCTEVLFVDLVFANCSKDLKEENSCFEEGRVFECVQVCLFQFFSAFNRKTKSTKKMEEGTRKKEEVSRWAKTAFSLAITKRLALSNSSTLHRDPPGRSGWIHSHYLVMKWVIVSSELVFWIDIDTKSQLALLQFSIEKSDMCFLWKFFAAIANCSTIIANALDQSGHFCNLKSKRTNWN